MAQEVPNSAKLTLNAPKSYVQLLSKQLGQLRALKNQKPTFNQTYNLVA